MTRENAAAEEGRARLIHTHHTHTQIHSKTHKHEGNIGLRGVKPAEEAAQLQHIICMQKVAMLAMTSSCIIRIIKTNEHLQMHTDTRFRSCSIVPQTGSVVDCAASSSYLLLPVWWRSGFRQASGARTGSDDLTPDGSNSAEKELLIKSLCNLTKLFFFIALSWKNIAAAKAERLFMAVPLIFCLRGQTQGP